MAHRERFCQQHVSRMRTTKSNLPLSSGPPTHSSTGMASHGQQWPLLVRTPWIDVLVQTFEDPLSATPLFFSTLPQTFGARLLLPVAWSLEDVPHSEAKAFGLLLVEADIALVLANFGQKLLERSSHSCEPGSAAISKKARSCQMSGKHQNSNPNGTHARSGARCADPKCQDIIRTCLIQTGAK